MSIFWDTIERLNNGLHRMWSSLFDNLRALAALFTPGGAAKAVSPALTRPFRLMLGLSLFLALTAACITADDPNAVWRLWLPVPFALFVVFVGLFDQAPLYRLRDLAGILLTVFLLIGIRLWHAAQVPIPFAALREVIQLFVSLTLMTAFWLISGRSPKLAQCVILGAFALASVVRWFVEPVALPFRPDLLPLLASLPWGLVVLGGVVRSANPAPRWHGRRWNPSLLLLGFIHLLFVAAGGAAAWFCMKWVRAFSVEEALLARRAEEAVQTLWSGSVLFGWGGANLPVIAKSMMEPAAIEIPDWTGPFGFLATHGLVSAIAAGCAVLALVWIGHRRRERERLGLGAPSVLALLAAQALLAYIPTGGPQTSVPFLVFAVWLGVGLAPNRRGRDLTWHAHDAPVEFGLIRGFAALGAFALYFTAAVASLGPVWARAYVNGIRERDFHDQARRSRLAGRLSLAMTVSPWDPLPLINDARRLRELLTDAAASGWDESLYGRITDAYDHAMRLDPYDVNTAMEFSRVQRLADRHNDAFDTIERGLATSPRNEALLNWAYITSTSRKDADRAMNAVRAGMAARPYVPQWWGRLFDVQSALGNGPEAGTALNVALTGNPGDPNMINLVAARRATPAQSAAAMAGESAPSVSTPVHKQVQRTLR